MKTQPTILIVDDEKDIISALVRCLHRLGLNLVHYSSPEQALEYTDNTRPDLVISDQRMPGMLGSEMLKAMKATWPDIHCILLSAYHDFDAVAEAFNQRIIDQYISKPWDNDELRFVVRKALKAMAPPEASAVDEQVEGLSHVHGMLGADESMQSVFDRISKAATANIPVFITGETGTGKELVARACHMESFRKSQPFIAVNCANFTEHLIESQLFGHNKGAFTGATGNQAGLFATAGEGTLFLDEVTTLPLPLQAKLLRVIQEREYAPLGSHEPQPFHAQIVTASSTTLADAVDSGEFREDLYYRLNVISIALPPLRLRGQDILLLADHFLKQLSLREKKSFGGFSDDARSLLMDFRWPGNVRQLENLLHGIVVLNDGPQITAEILNQSLQGERDRSSAREPYVNKKVINRVSSTELAAIPPLWQVEKEAIESAIAICEGNIPKAAALLDISASTIYRKQKLWQ
jgi:two-component system repressor protein LuxO